MLDWLDRQGRDQVFLDDGARTMTYGEAADRARVEATPDSRVVRPGLDIESALSVLTAGSPGVVVVDPPEVRDLMDPGEGTVMVVYTSGSTGQPKGVRLTSANWEAACAASTSHLGNGSVDTWLLVLPLSHVGGIGTLLRSAYAGGAVRILDRPDPKSLASALRQVTMASVVPTMLHRVLEVDKGPFPGLRAVLVGGGPIPDGLLERAADAGIPCLPSYGMTETCGQIATLRPGSVPERKAHSLPGAEIRVGPGGRLEVRGPMVSPGYLGEPDRAGEWFTTSDLGELDSSGAVRVIGRSDEVIVTGGHKVSPESVERALSALAGVDETVVVGVPSPEWGMEIGCLYVGLATPGEVADAIREVLPVHMVPRRIDQVVSLPSTVLGKPDRVAARAMLEGTSGKGRS